MLLDLRDRSAVRFTRDWYAPVGGVLLAGCGLYALIGVPLDATWHPIFGQDITLWGPTHLMMIGGAGLSLFVVLLLEYEGGQALPGPPDERPFVKLLRYLPFGLIGWSVFQIGYDFGAGQFRLALQPMMIAGAAALASVAARMTMGHGAAIVAALLAIALRGGLRRAIRAATMVPLAAGFSLHMMASSLISRGSPRRNHRCRCLRDPARGAMARSLFQSR